MNKKKSILMTQVTSSQINSVGYNVDDNTLYVEFKTYVVYSYINVPIDHYHKMVSSTVSPGGYLNRMIKGIFDYHKETAVVVDGNLEI